MVIVILISAETAAGQYPIEAVSIMGRIVKRIEEDEGWRNTKAALRPAAVPKSKAPALPPKAPAAAKPAADDMGDWESF